MTLRSTAGEPPVREEPPPIPPGPAPRPTRRRRPRGTGAAGTGVRDTGGRVHDDTVSRPLRVLPLVPSAGPSFTPCPLSSPLPSPCLHLCLPTGRTLLPHVPVPTSLGPWGDCGAEGGRPRGRGSETVGPQGGTGVPVDPRAGVGVRAGVRAPPWLRASRAWGAGTEGSATGTRGASPGSTAFGVPPLQVGLVPRRRSPAHVPTDQTAPVALPPSAPARVARVGPAPTAVTEAVAATPAPAPLPTPRDATRATTTEDVDSPGRWERGSACP